MQNGVVKSFINGTKFRYDSTGKFAARKIRGIQGDRTKPYYLRSSAQHTTILSINSGIYIYARLNQIVKISTKETVQKCSIRSQEMR